MDLTLLVQSRLDRRFAGGCRCRSAALADGRFTVVCASPQERPLAPDQLAQVARLLAEMTDPAIPIELETVTAVA